MIKMTVEKVMEAKAEIEALLPHHYDELTLHKEIAKLEPDWNLYRRAEESGSLFFLAVREDGKLVGYAVFFIKQNLHYKGMRTASNDVLFLASEYRQGSTGLKLIKSFERELKQREVDLILCHAKQGTVLGELLITIGYGVEDIILGKVLENRHGN